MIMPVMNIVSYISYLLLMLIPAKQYISTSYGLLALPPPFLGCASIQINATETYVSLLCAQWVFDNPFALQP